MIKQSKINLQDNPRNYIIEFSITFFPLLLILLGVVLYLYSQETATLSQSIELREQYKVNLKKEYIIEEFNTNKSDLMFLHDLIYLNEVFNSTSSHTALLEQYLAFSKRRGIYDQIRILNAEGIETVGIDYNNGNPHIIPPKSLQDKSHRYYFIYTFKLNEGDIYISPFDLNMKNKQIEKPIKPVLRFSTPVFDLNGNKKGILILNYLGKPLLDSSKAISKNSFGEAELLNSNGYWLSSQNKEKEWGFMYRDKMNETYKKYFPNAWKEIFQKESGQFYDESSLFTFETVYPFGKNEANSNKIENQNYYWKIVSHISKNNLQSKFQPVINQYYKVFILCSILLSFIAYFLVKNKLNQKDFEMKLDYMAHFDSLTNLPNRTLFYNHLNTALSMCSKKNTLLGLMFLDLDGFKAVNDTYGHDVGDLLLQEVAQVLQNTVSEKNIVGRIGGDEFTIILPHISQKEDLALMAQNILDALSQPFHLKNNFCLVKASIGISIYPIDGTGIELLIQKADIAMYHVKQNYKNGYKFFSELPPENDNV